MARCDFCDRPKRKCACAERKPGRAKGVVGKVKEKFSLPASEPVLPYTPPHVRQECNFISGMGWDERTQSCITASGPPYATREQWELGRATFSTWSDFMKRRSR